MIGLVDYGAGNLQSVANSLDHLGLPFSICTQPGQLAPAERIILPGVGHFRAASRSMAASGMLETLRRQVDQGKPILGICLGLQLLLSGSDEAPEQQGLGLLPGRAVALDAERVPHMGWNRVMTTGASPFLDPGDDAYFYFAHSYVARLDDPAHNAGEVSIDGSVHPVVIGHRSVWGVQFHPEKSGEAGLRLLSRFSRC